MHPHSFPVRTSFTRTIDPVAESIPQGINSGLVSAIPILLPRIATEPFVLDARPSRGGQAQQFPSQQAQDTQRSTPAIGSAPSCGPNMSRSYTPFTGDGDKGLAAAEILCPLVALGDPVRRNTDVGAGKLPGCTGECGGPFFTVRKWRLLAAGPREVFEGLVRVDRHAVYEQRSRGIAQRRRHAAPAQVLVACHCTSARFEKRAHRAFHRLVVFGKHVVAQQPVRFQCNRLDELVRLRRVLRHRGNSHVDLPRVGEHAHRGVGGLAMEWAEWYCGDLWSRLREEARGVCFSTGSRGWEGIEFDGKSLTTWSPCDRAYMGLLPGLVAEGRYLEEAIEVIGILDQRIAEEWMRLRYDTRIDDTKLRNGQFAISFAIPALSPCAPAISWICAGIGNAVGIARMDCFRSPKDTVPTETHRMLLERDLSQGQLYFLLQRSRGVEIPASFLARTIECLWESAPYHLRIALLHSAAMNTKGEEADRTKLLKAVDELRDGGDLYVSDSILETLQMLGALDDDAEEHRIPVLENVRECLARPADRDSQVQAWIIYCSQFEHPYSAAYFEIVSELGNGDRKMLLEMAADGVGDTSFWLTPLLIDLASIGDRNSGGSIARWSRVPEAEDRVMPQEDIAVFVVAHIALARLGCPLPDKQIAAGSASAEALAACGAILYWINRSDLRVDERLTECGQALGVLEKQAKGLALDVVCECEWAVYGKARRLPEEGEKVRSIVGTFPAETAAICRIGLLHPGSQTGYFSHFGEHDRQRNIGFAIGVLKDHGSVMDRPLLGRYASSGEYGRDAIAAVRAIEEREMENAGGIA